MKNLFANKKHLALMVVAVILALVSWGIAIYYWRLLPQTIPTHFGFSGEPDAWSDKSIIYVFMIPALQTLLLAGFLFIYEKPQYSDMPTTLLLMSMDKDHREHAFGLIRVMLVGTTLWLGMLFSYLSWAINASALSTVIGPNPYIMGGLVGGMLLWLIWYTVKVYRYTKTFLKKD